MRGIYIDFVISIWYGSSRSNLHIMWYGVVPQFVNMHMVGGRHSTNHFVLHRYNYACTYMHSAVNFNFHCVMCTRIIIIV